MLEKNMNNILCTHFFLDLPIMPLSLAHDIQDDKLTLSWQLPKGFYTGLAVEECSYDNKCKILPVGMNVTNLLLEARTETSYRLVAYQDGQQVAASQLIVEDFSLHGKFM